MRESYDYDEVESGFIYVLEHPSDPTLFKIGRTYRKPEQRLTEHNSDFTRLAGSVVQETGQKWVLTEFIAVPDPAHAEAVFWEATFPGPFKGKEEVVNMQWNLVQMGLNAARKAGIRPRPKPRTKPVRNRVWMIKQLEGTSLTMIGHYRGLQTGVEFECSNGHVFKASPGLVANMKYCPFCEGRWYTAYKQ